MLTLKQAGPTGRQLAIARQRKLQCAYAVWIERLLPVSSVFPDSTASGTFPAGQPAMGIGAKGFNAHSPTGMS